MTQERPEAQPGALVQISTDISARKDIDPVDFRTLIEMYAYKYTKGVAIEDAYSHITAEHVKRQIGDSCTIIAPIDARSGSIPLQMTFRLQSQGTFSNYFAYPRQEVESGTRNSRTRSRPEEEWLRDLENFFGPLEIGVGMENYFETQGYRSTLGSDLVFMSYSESDSGYGFSKTNMKAPLTYLGYKHSVFRPLFEKQEKATGIGLRATELARSYLPSFPGLPADAIKSVIATILQSRETQLSDRAIFYELARQFHPDLQPTQGNTLLIQLMKLLNEMYDSTKRKFSFD